ncbi:hypothetical protein LTR17_016462 [Elasticomyces elasticus]|nr:hypothetical protein LTR17_016462 [Elasticomyces elasticus]
MPVAQPGIVILAGVEELPAAQNKDILVTCDMAAWPKLKAQRPSGVLAQFATHRRDSKITLFWCIFLMILCIGSNSLRFAVIQYKDLELAINIFLLLVNIILPLAYMYVVENRGHDIVQYYSGLESFLEDSDPKEYWWRRVDRMLPVLGEGQSQDMIMSEKIEVFALHCVVAILCCFDGNDREGRQSEARSPVNGDGIAHGDL